MPRPTLREALDQVAREAPNARHVREAWRWSLVMMAGGLLFAVAMFVQWLLS